MILSERKRHANDEYTTPVAVCEAALREYAWINPKTALDSGAGTGNWGRAAKRVWPNLRLIGVEINPERPNLVNQATYDEWHTVDFLEFTPTQEIDLIFGNPPFGLAEEFVRRAMSESSYTIFLLRLAFLESKRRHVGLWQTHRPVDVSVLAERIPWENHEMGAKGKTDDTANAIYFWGDLGWQETHLKWISWRKKDENR